jgi:glyoxylase I family protein
LPEAGRYWQPNLHGSHGIMAVPPTRLLKQRSGHQSWPMPEIAGQVVVLTVTDAERSTAWYRDLLGMEETSRYVEPDGRVALVHLAESRSGMELCLVAHRASGGRFDEFQVGLDHLEFLVTHRSDLDAWAAQLDKLGIPHSGIKEPSYTANAMLTFRDPDNIQLEFFWRPG